MLFCHEKVSIFVMSFLGPHHCFLFNNQFFVWCYNASSIVFNFLHTLIGSILNALISKFLCRVFESNFTMISQRCLLFIFLSSYQLCQVLFYFVPNHNIFTFHKLGDIALWSCFLFLNTFHVFFLTNLLCVNLASIWLFFWCSLTIVNVGCLFSSSKN